MLLEVMKDKGKLSFPTPSLKLTKAGNPPISVHYYCNCNLSKITTTRHEN